MVGAARRPAIHAFPPLPPFHSFYFAYHFPRPEATTLSAGDDALESGLAADALAGPFGGSSAARLLPPPATCSLTSVAPASTDKSC